jgi:hypothetical protein
VDDRYNGYRIYDNKQPCSVVDPAAQRIVIPLFQCSSDHGNRQEIFKKANESVCSRGQATTAIQSDTSGIHVIFGIRQFFVGINLL